MSLSSSRRRWTETPYFFAPSVPLCFGHQLPSLPERVKCRPVAPLTRRVLMAVPTESPKKLLSLRQRNNPERERCVLVGVDITTRKAAYNTRIFGIKDSLDELARLAETAGMCVVGVITQTMPSPSPATYIGTGKVHEVRQNMEAEGCCTCIFDVELSPAQQRTLETEFGGEAQGIKVLDRTALILDIFAQHAATREGQLQVELALYQYRLPRLTRMWTHLERQSGSGGVGLRGPGETQLESDRRMINTRVNKLKRDLELVRAHRARLRKARRQSIGLPVVALIGYTNAGKSTVLNAMTGAHALAADALFATLDPTTRRASLEGLKLNPEVLVTDTVGFVQNLPTQLVAAFRATLEEVVDADVLVHVVDGSLEKDVMKMQMQAVDTVLEQIGARGKPTVVVLNKADLLEETDTAVIVAEIEEHSGHSSVPASAKSGRGLAELGILIDEALRNIMLSVEVVIPYSRGDLVAAIYSQGSVEAENFVEAGTYIMAKVPAELSNKLRQYFVESAIVGSVDMNLDGAPVEEVYDAVGVSEEERWTDMAKKRHAPRGE